MVPIALELGAGGETRSPMAIAVIGGFTTSTLLTLVVVPVIFTYIDGLNDGISKFFRRFNRPKRGKGKRIRKEGEPKPYTLSK